MLLQEILDDVNSYVPNSIDAKTKIRWLNNIQRQIFRDYPALSLTQATIPTVSQQSDYLLPADCPLDRIRNVTVNGVEYDYAEYQDYPSDQYWTIKSWITNGNETITINPLPAVSGLPIVINYQARPVDLTTSDLGNKPNFAEDYHELLVFGLASRVAKAQQDITLANNFDAEFLTLATIIKQDFTGYRSKQVRRVRNWT